MLACIAGTAAPAGLELRLPSCVSGSPPLVLSGGSAPARLDAADRRQLHDAALARYPLYQRGGLVPADVLLAQQGRHWIYITLAPKGHGAACFTAVFAAERFDFTERWVARYRQQAGVLDD